MTFVAMNHLAEPVREFETEEEAEAYIGEADALNGLGWTVEEVDKE